LEENASRISVNLLGRDPPHLSRLASSDHETDDLEFDAATVDHDDDEEDEQGAGQLLRLRFFN